MARGIVGFHGKKSPVTPPGIDHRTFRLLAQCLNQYDSPGPIIIIRIPKTLEKKYTQLDNWSLLI
jgi:hypothetical protein